MNLEEFPPAGEPIWNVSMVKDIQMNLRSNWQSEQDIRICLLAPNGEVGMKHAFASTPRLCTR